MALNAITNVFRVAELRTRLAYSLGLLAIYRLGIFINTPGVNRAAMNAYFDARKKSPSGTRRAPPARGCGARRAWARPA